MGEILIRYVKQELSKVCSYTHIGAYKILLILSFYTELAKNAFKERFAFFFRQKKLHIAMALPVFVLVLLGFIPEDKNYYFGHLNSATSTLYPINQDYIPILKVPSSGKIPLKQNVDSFFTQYSKHTAETPLDYQDRQEPEKKQTLAHSQVQTLVSLDMQQQPSKMEYIVFNQLASAVDNTKGIIAPPTKDINAKESSFLHRKRSYAPYVQRYSQKYRLDPSLVLAIIYAESVFLPHVVSTQNAHGLMQIVPETAGTEVYKFLKKEGKPSSHELMHPETNISYGTAYIYLLRRYHLVGIENSAVKNVLTIASYNAGSGAVLRHFGSTRAEAVRKINDMEYTEVLNSILTSFRSSETRRYVRKVLSYMGSM